MAIGWWCLVVICLPNFADANLADGKPLYDARDPMVLLNSSNFETTIYGTKNAWIVEFYNTWCGHCVNFAPVWKEFAKDVLAWKKIIAVAAIDCAADENVPICREYDVHMYPTIKLFKPFTRPKDMGLNWKGTKDKVTIRHGLVDFIENYLVENNRPDWPDFAPSVKFTASGLWRNVPASINTIVVIVEKNSTYTGREVMLDLCDFPGVKVVRVLPENRVLLSQLGISSYPAMVLLNRSLQTHLYTISEHMRDSYVEFVARHLPKNNLGLKPDELGGADEGLGAGDEPKEEEEDPETRTVEEPIMIKDQVYMVDLENAVRYSLAHEVALNRQMEGAKLDALRQYLAVLVKYFPGRQPIKTFLTNVYHWLLAKSSATAEDYLDYLNQTKTATSFLPTMQPFMGCRGSKPRYRGYPCSLWTLFHTLTVAAYNNRAKSVMYDPLEVLSAMSGYIKHFFGCEQCSRHFQEMAQSLSSDVKEAGDGVLWLWQAHNKVNARLHGDLTEDPHHPKVQFPPSDLCSSCQLTTDEAGQWDLSEVLSFLVSRYSGSAISLINVAFVSLAHNNESDAGVHQLPAQKASVAKRQVVVKAIDGDDSVSYVGGYRKRTGSTSWGFSAIDVSLCVVLYISSAAILLTVYFIVVVKRRLRKKSYQRMSSALI